MAKKKYKELKKFCSWQKDSEYLKQFDEDIRLCIQLLRNYQEIDAHKYGSATRFNNELNEFIFDMGEKFLNNYDE